MVRYYHHFILFSLFIGHTLASARTGREVRMHANRSLCEKLTLEHSFDFTEFGDVDVNFCVWSKRGIFRPWLRGIGLDVVVQVIRKKYWRILRSYSICWYRRTLTRKFPFDEGIPHTKAQQSLLNRNLPAVIQRERTFPESFDPCFVAKWDWCLLSRHCCGTNTNHEVPVLVLVKTTREVLLAFGH